MLPCLLSVYLSLEQGKQEYLRHHRGAKGLGIYNKYNVYKKHYGLAVVPISIFDSSEICLTYQNVLKIVLLVTSKLLTCQVKITETYLSRQDR